MTFREQIAADAKAILDSDGFAEDITYRPKGGQTKTIRAVVDRRGLAPRETDKQTTTHGIVIQVARLDVPTVLAPGDQVTLGKHSGGATETFMVQAVLSEDEGIWELGLGK